MEFALLVTMPLVPLSQKLNQELVQELGRKAGVSKAAGCSGSELPGRVVRELWGRITMADGNSGIAYFLHRCSLSRSVLGIIAFINETVTHWHMKTTGQQH